MKPIFATFTEGERRLLIFVFVTLAIGGGLVEWQERAQSSLVFNASDRAQPAERKEIPAPVGLDPATGKVDVNLADAEVLQTLPGIGPAMAAAILQHRDAYGPLAGVDDLDKVPGIGPAKLATLAPRIAFGQHGAPAASSLTAGNAPAQHPPASATGMGTSSQVNINSATAEQLQILSGVGPALAQRIIEDRQARGPYRTAADLDRVRGIGPSILSKNAHLITVR